MVDQAAVRAAVGRVQDPELHRSLEELNMLRELEVDDAGTVRVLVALTIPGCPLKDKLTTDVTAAASRDTRWACGRGASPFSATSTPGSTPRFAALACGGPTLPS